jgi:hypothetical protein
VSNGPDYVDVARFSPHDRAEVVTATFACPWCLAVPGLGALVERSDESFIELVCALCGNSWRVVVDRMQLLRLMLVPPPEIELEPR